MTEIKFYCDGCKKEVGAKEELTDIRLSMKIGDRYPDSFMAICNECIEDLGFVDCKNDKKYVNNYSHFINNTMEIIKKLFGNNKK